MPLLQGLSVLRSGVAETRKSKARMSSRAVRVHINPPWVGAGAECSETLAIDFTRWQKDQPGLRPQRPEGGFATRFDAPFHLRRSLGGRSDPAWRHGFEGQTARARRRDGTFHPRLVLVCRSPPANAMENHRRTQPWDTFFIPRALHAPLASRAAIWED